MASMRTLTVIIAQAFLVVSLLAAEPKKQPAAPAARPAPTRPSAPAGIDPKATAAINKAVATLTKEFAEHEKDAINPLRKTSNYFKEKDSGGGDVTHEAILSALEKTVNRDPRIDSYIKWQLLSAVNDRFDPKLGYKAVSVYQRAARPAMRPGIEESEKRELVLMLPPPPIDDAETADEINRQWKERLYKAGVANDFVLRYRNELFSKLPLSGAVIRAGLEDAYTRVMNGISSDKFFEENISKSAKEWANGASSGELQEIANLVGAVAGELTGKTPKSPEFFTQVRHDAKNSKINWEKGRATFAQVKEIDELVGYLRDQAQRAQRSTAGKR
jgi:hypothetical protein